MSQISKRSRLILWATLILLPILSEIEGRIMVMFFKNPRCVNVVHIKGGYSCYRKVVIETGRPNGGMFVLCGALHLRQ